MLFFKIQGTMANYSQPEEDRTAERAKARNIYSRTEDFNENHCRDAFCFFSKHDYGAVTLGMIIEDPSKTESTLNKFLKHTQCDLVDVTVTEITVDSIAHLLAIASHHDYIDDDDEVLEKFGIDKVYGRHLDFGENLIGKCEKEEAYLKAKRCLFNETLLPELDRIYAGTSSNIFGHPVHYILQTDDRELRRDAYKTLLEALHANQRLKCQRYSFLDFRPGERFSTTSYDALYKISEGGAIVIRYLANDESEEDSFASGEMDTIEKICESAKKYRNKVLTILCLPRECKKAKSLFYENLGSMSFVELREDFVDGEQACDLLKWFAKEHKIRPDKALYSRLEEGKKYLGSDLHLIFDEWFNNKLKVSVFPQYKDLKSAKQSVVKSSHKGSAYSDLQNMIGLTEAKAVIQKALNYYKMQKLYEEKGVKRDSPAMHMVFSGNPGTAKTTAARLFTRIMADNGLISRGQLVEVGRGDLVGKYVGWTAQTVQSKFKAASGGVLFIDEAYSLVDDRNGSFGDEAINTIVQEMENHREDVVVIFAGYPDKMEEFLNKNPGLRSRIAFHVPFADYTATELCEIATIMGKSKGVSFEEDALVKLKSLFEIACKQPDFGNGRYVRNILEQAKMNQASRILEYNFDEVTDTEITTIKAEDIVMPAVAALEKRRIGFV